MSGGLIRSTISYSIRAFILVELEFTEWKFMTGIDQVPVQILYVYLQQLLEAEAIIITV